MKKFLAIFLPLLLIITTLPLSTATANSYARITFSCSAQVINVIDGDSMRVRLLHSGEVALVRLIGVDATGRDDAFNYLVSRIMGKTVTIDIDSSLNHYIDRWNLVYMTYNNQLINSEMLAGGYARLNESHSLAWRYGTLARNQDTARSNELGRWAREETTSMSAYSGEGLNINTATSSQLQNILSGVSAATARNIVRYRENNPFRTIGDIKFVDGFTKELFDNNRRYMTVSTNVNTASREELLTLADIRSTEVSRIINYRSNNNIRHIEDIYYDDLVSYDVYDRNKPFISISSRSEITHTVPSTIININTATQSQLTNIGFTTRQATALIDHRKNYGYKTLEELAHVPNVELSKSRLDELADNLTVRTDINNAPNSEIRSLLGSTSNASTVASTIERNRTYRTYDSLRNRVDNSVYDAFIPFVYITQSDAVPKRVNLNTATRDQLLDTGFSSSQASSIESNRPIRHSGQLPINTFSFDRNIALYTNVNTATYEELRSLHTDMTDGVVNAIISYRRVQPFSTQSELRDFFVGWFATNAYSAIRDYVVFR